MYMCTNVMINENQQCILYSFDNRSVYVKKVKVEKKKIFIVEKFYSRATRKMVCLQ